VFWSKGLRPIAVEEYPTPKLFVNSVPDVSKTIPKDLDELINEKELVSSPPLLTKLDESVVKQFIYYI
jgi:hypothetical protein